MGWTVRWSVPGGEDIPHPSRLALRPTQPPLQMLQGLYLPTYSIQQSPSWEADQSLQLVKKFPEFYGTRKFFTVLTSVGHPSLSWAKSIQSPRPPPTSWRSILVLSSRLRLGLPNGLFPSGFPINTLCTPLGYRVFTRGKSAGTWRWSPTPT
jgi:hypothetical protein